MKRIGGLSLLLLGLSCCILDSEPGERGEQGTRGEPGVDGGQGPKGAPGVDGGQGQTGLDGTPGQDGQDGADGVSPFVGPDPNDGSIYYNGGNVGIGVATPGHLLEVRRDQDLHSLIQVTNNSNGPNAAAGIYLESETVNLPSAGFGIRRYAGGSAAFSDGGSSLAGATMFSVGGYSSSFIFNPGSTGDYRFEIGNVERMRIGSDGNVGIGMTSPTVPLEVAAQSTGTFEDILYLTQNYLGTYGYVFKVDNTNSGDLYLQRREIGNEPAGEVVTVTSDAWLGVRTKTPQCELDVNGLACLNGIGLSSDRRWKTDIDTIAGAMDLVKQLRGVTFKWRQNIEGHIFPGGPQVGLIAQEVEEVLPELVETGPDGYKRVDYSRLSAVLVEGAKGLQGQNEELAGRVLALEERIDKLEGQRPAHASVLSIDETWLAWLGLGLSLGLGAASFLKRRGRRSRVC